MQIQSFFNLLGQNGRRVTRSIVRCNARAVIDFLIRPRAFFEVLSSFLHFKLPIHLVEVYKSDFNSPFLFKNCKLPLDRVVNRSSSL